MMLPVILVVDVQGDFTEWRNGPLAVPGTGEAYVRRAEEAVRRFRDAGCPVLASQDWHPAGAVLIESPKDLV